MVWTFNKNLRVFIVLCLVCAFAATSSHSQEASRYNTKGIDQYGHSRYSTIDEPGYLEKWANQKWTADSAPFLIIRRGIKRLMREKKLASRLPAWQKEALEHPEDARLQYRYVSGAYDIELIKHGVHNADSNLIRRLCWHLSLPKNPKAYHYDRLRFQVENHWRRRLVLLPLGKRLVARDPKDAHVRYWTNILRNSSDNINDHLSLLKEVKARVKKSPQDAESRRGLAAVYFSLWGKTKKRSYSSLAVQQYKEFLKLYPDIPQNRARREKIKGWIKSIPESQREYEKKGVGTAN